ncbi:MAG: hypothetical protein ACFE96_12310 [Candidatus Hermodarchaeota archaeon]
MELFQVFWDDQKKLFLEFEKNEEEQVLFLPEKINRLNIQFEISKIVKQEIYYKKAPSLVSIKKIYHSNDYLGFSIELDEIHSFSDIQIKILKLTIYLYSGQRIEYTFSEKFNVSDIWVNDDCYAGFQFVDLSVPKNQRKKITRERVVKATKTDFTQKKEEKTVIYEKRSIESIPTDQSFFSMMHESNKTLKSIEKHLASLALTLQNMPVNPVSYGPPSGVPQRIPGPGIERTSHPDMSSLIQGQGSSAKLLVIKEMKTIFRATTEKNNGFSIKDILKPMDEKELQSITLSDDVLREKEEVAIANQIKRFKKNQEKKIELDQLKAPN